MKRTTFFLFVAFMSVTATSFSQIYRMSLNLENRSLAQIFDEIEQNSEFSIFYKNDLLENRNTKSIHTKDALISDILNEILKGENLTYMVRGKIIMVVPEEQTKKDKQSEIVNGLVNDDTGQALAGVSVSIKGTTQGTITGTDGIFSLAGVTSNSILVFSFIGMVTKEVEVSGQENIQITMEPLNIGIDEVIAIGYGSTTKSNITTSVSKISANDVPSSVNNSINQLLFGRAVGLQATQQSAEPGGNIFLSIRGRGNPLIVVDGIIVPGSGLEPGSGIEEIDGVKRGGISDLNPSDVESIEVLKDASAAIYGIGASNGVILITTKRGKSGKMKIVYEGNRSLVTNMPYLKPLNAKEYMSYFNQFSTEQFLFEQGMGAYGGKEISGLENLPLYTPDQIENAGVATDWMAEVLQNGSVDNHNITMQGGQDKYTYYLSTNYFNQVGTMQNSGLTRYVTRMNASYKPYDPITVRANVNYNRTNYLNSTAGWQTGGSGAQGFGALQAALSYPSNLPIQDDDGNFTQFSVTGNPVTLLKISDNTKNISVNANIAVDVNIIPKLLTAQLRYGNYYENSYRTFYIPSDVFWNQILQSRATINQASRQNQTMEGVLTFKKGIRDIINMNVIAGMGQYIDDSFGFGVVATDILDAINTDNIGAAPNLQSSYSYRSYGKRRSYFTRGSFDIQNRYLVALTYRLDGTDKFFPDNKYEGFPSASLGWKINNEKFLKDLKFIDLLKIRASYGITGRDIGTAAYGNYSPEGTRGLTYFDNGNTAYTPYYETRIDQPGLKWEKTVNMDMGIDFGFLDNHISGSIDFFQDQVTNLLTSRATNQLSYIPTAYKNDGAHIRNGYDISLRTVNVSSKDFQWDMIINLNHFNYRWEKRFENSDIQPYVGKKDPVNAIYVFETDGILKAGEVPNQWQPAKATMPGAPKFVDRNNDSKLDTADVVMYSGDPKHVIGFGNTFRYKNFDLNIFFYGQFGAYDFNNSLLWANPKGIASGTVGATTDIRNAWSLSNPDGIWPGVAYDETILGLPASIDTRLMSKDFLRCRNITLGYTLQPKRIADYVSSVRMYADVQNAFIFTKYMSADPETQANSVKGGPAPYPMARTFSLGIHVEF